MIEFYQSVFSTQEGPEDVSEIKVPEYTISENEIEQTIDLLYLKALETGEAHSEHLIMAGRGPAPHAHRATNSYHAIEIIRQLQAQIQALKESTP